MPPQNLTSGERAYLRSLANQIESILRIGKGGVTDNVIAQANQALDARELIKISILETADCPPKETAALLARRTDSQSVQVIGRKIVLYRQARDKDRRHIELPK